MTPDLQKLRRVIELLWPELPDLLAENWPKFQAQLLAYLEQSDQQPGHAGIYRAFILRLFGDYRPAHERLLELLNPGSTKEAFTVRGLERNQLPNAASLGLESTNTTVTRYTDIVAPVRVPLNQRFPLIVGLTCAPMSDSSSAQAIEAPVGAAIRVVLTSAALEVIGERVKEVVVQEKTDSEPAVFYLRAQHLAITPCSSIFGMPARSSPAASRASKPLQNLIARSPPSWRPSRCQWTPHAHPILT